MRLSILNWPLQYETAAQADLSIGERALIDRLQKLEEGLAPYLEQIERGVQRIDTTLSELTEPILRTDDRVAQILERLRGLGLPTEHLSVQVIIPTPMSPQDPSDITSNVHV